MENEKTDKEIQLPALLKEVSQEIKEQEEADKKHLVRLQRYSRLNNRNLEEGKLQEHPFVKGTRYLPISYMEMALDRIYFGLWSTENFRWEVIMNEVVASMEVKVFHPVAKAWITRNGAAALKIMTDKIPEVEAKGMSKPDINKWHLNTENKKPNALEAGGFAKLKAECFKNAVQSIGKYFGRDANRKFEDDFVNLITDMEAEILKHRKMVSEAMDSIQDDELKQEYVDKILTAEEEGKNTLEFYKEIYFEIAPDGNS